MDTQRGLASQQIGGSRPSRTVVQSSAGSPGSDITTVCLATPGTRHTTRSRHRDHDDVVIYERNKQRNNLTVGALFAKFPEKTTVQSIRWLSSREKTMPYDRNISVDSESTDTLSSSVDVLPLRSPPRQSRLERKLSRLSTRRTHTHRSHREKDSKYLVVISQEKILVCVAALLVIVAIVVIVVKLMLKQESH